MSGAGLKGIGAISLFDDEWHPIAQLAITIASSHAETLGGRLDIANPKVVVERIEDLHHSRIVLRRIGPDHTIEA